MGYWSFYFFAKIGLYWARVLSFHVWPNLLFALALSVPIAPRHVRLRLLRNVIAAIAGVGLLWLDTGLPGPFRLAEQWSDLSQFSLNYWLDLFSRMWSWQVVGALLLGAAVWGVLFRRVRLGVVAIVLTAALMWLPLAAPDHPEDDPVTAAANPADGSASSASLAPGSSLAIPRPVTLSASATRDDDAPLDGPELDRLLAAFYEQQQHRGVKFPDQHGVPPFDLLILSVCSLSWDDLAVAGLDNAPLLRRMDLLFRQFNSAASYSGPAVLRLLHGTCGQTPQAELYGAVAPDCYLFSQLEQLGYHTSFLLNHDGHYDGFADQLRRQGGLDMKPVDHSAASIALYGFDNSPIYDDYDVLSRWWHGQTDTVPDRAANSVVSNAMGAAINGTTGTSGVKIDGNKRLALLYNTITLHDGNRPKGQVAGNSLLSWPTRARKLFSDMERMLALVEQSGRPTVVVLIPEHGAGLRGDSTQIPGLREFPTPRITHVPAGVALLNFGPRPADAAPVMVDQVSSYTSLMAVVGTLMQQKGSPYDALKQVGAALPSEDWVAENEGTLVFSRDGRNYLRTREGRWSH